MEPMVVSIKLQIYQQDKLLQLRNSKKSMLLGMNVQT